MNKYQITDNKEQKTRTTDTLHIAAQLLLVAVLLIFSACQNPLTPSNLVESAGNTGWFSLTLEDSGAARTILPATVQSDFAAYTLEFFAAGTDSPAIDPVDRTNGNLSAPVQLAVGTWDLYVSAYMDAEKTMLAAKGELKGMVITAGNTVVQNVLLAPILDGIGKGIFSWNISYPSNVTQASMTITRMPITSENELTAQTILLTGMSPNIGSVELYTGYYRVMFKLENNVTFKAERWETMQIYQNMNSPFEFAFTDSHFITGYYSNISNADIEDFGSEAEISEIFNVGTEVEWNNAINLIASGGDDQNYIINVTDDFAIRGSTTNNFGSVSGINISLRSDGRTLSLSTTNGNLLRLGNNQTLILRNLNLLGKKKDVINVNDVNKYHLVHVSDSGTFVMHGGEISDNFAYISGGGVGVYGTFVMHGGKISDNITSASYPAAGVCVYSSGTFVMHGGEISGNRSAGNSGGVMVDGTFVMHGGEISGNRSANRGGGVYVFDSGIFVMHGGKISGNTAPSGGGVYVRSSGTFFIETGIIYGSNEEIESLRNTTGYSGAALEGKAQYGTFNDGTWNSNGTLGTTDNTIRVVDGVVVYTVTYHINGGSGATPTAQIVTAGSSVTLAGDSGFSRSGYVFAGWNTDSSGTGTNYSAGSSYSPSGNVTLHARWFVAIEMLRISGGTFTMGSNDDTGIGYDASPPHQVTVSSFYMGKYEITQEQYQNVTGVNTSYHSTNPASWEVQGKRPVENVTWYDAVEFCNKLSQMEGLTPVYTITGRSPSSGHPITSATVTANWEANGYRLPTEAEWEYACRAGTSTAWSYGSSGNGNYMYYFENSNGISHEVGRKLPNPWGLYDMYGNVWEWCWDWIGVYSGAAETDPRGTVSSIDARVQRGGCCMTVKAQFLSSAFRLSDGPGRKNITTGFRVVRP